MKYTADKLAAGFVAGLAAAISGQAVVGAAAAAAGGFGTLAMSAWGLLYGVWFVSLSQSCGSGVCIRYSFVLLSLATPMALAHPVLICG